MRHDIANVMVAVCTAVRPTLTGHMFVSHRTIDVPTHLFTNDVAKGARGPRGHPLNSELDLADGGEGLLCSE